jgi:hypothetical protein
MNDVWMALGAFAATFLIDIFYTRYLLAVQARNQFVASHWAVIVFLIGSLITIGYTTNPWLLIPAGIGAWFGTLVGIRWNDDLHN